jgi:hypothetical protein
MKGREDKINNPDGVQVFAEAFVQLQAFGALLAQRI